MSCRVRVACVRLFSLQSYLWDQFIDRGDNGIKEAPVTIPAECADSCRKQESWSG